MIRRSCAGGLTAAPEPEAVSSSEWTPEKLHGLVWLCCTHRGTAEAYFFALFPLNQVQSWRFVRKKNNILRTLLWPR